MLAAALDTGCDAVHPGYGFLAENAAFAQQVIDAGLRWVGPTPEQISLLGDKVAAKRAAVAAGVPTAPVFDAAPDDLPDDIPFPALVKAAAGGGGRGMRVVRRPGRPGRGRRAPHHARQPPRSATAPCSSRRTWSAAVTSRCRSWATSTATSCTWVTVTARCSAATRRSWRRRLRPVWTTTTRTALADGALALARHVGYRSAGTVEFLVGEDGTINFLEVNTRLQVEHPVTEAVTGLDLVELQLRIAAGEPLPVEQRDVTLRGHAVEARLVAEDPDAGWLPSTGRVERFEAPTSARCDAAVAEGSVVSADYDSLLAKIVTHATRQGDGGARLGRALRSTQVVGPRTNLAMLVASSRSRTSCRRGHHVATSSTTRRSSRRGVGRRPSLVAGRRSAVVRVAARTADHHWGFAPSGWRNLRSRRHGHSGTTRRPARTTRSS